MSFYLFSTSSICWLSCFLRSLSHGELIFSVFFYWPNERRYTKKKYEHEIFAETTDKETTERTNRQNFKMKNKRTHRRIERASVSVFVCVWRSFDFCSSKYITRNRQTLSFCHFASKSKFGFSTFGTESVQGHARIHQQKKKKKRLKRQSLDDSRKKNAATTFRSKPRKTDSVQWQTE